MDLRASADIKGDDEDEVEEKVRRGQYKGVRWIRRGGEDDAAGR